MITKDFEDADIDKNNPPTFTWKSDDKELSFIYSKIEEKIEQSKLTNYYLYVEEDSTFKRELWELYSAERLIKNTLTEMGKNPSDELLNNAAKFFIQHKNIMQPTPNPVRNHWFIQLLCDMCDGKDVKFEEL